MTSHPPPKWYIVINPVAGSGQAKRRWPAIQQLLRSEGFRFQPVFTHHQGHAIDLVNEAIHQGYRHFVALGGDGTNHEVANGLLLQQQVPPDELYYALLPVGTGNDWCKTYNIPRQPRRWIQLLHRLNTRLQDVGVVHYHQQGKQQQRYFVNVAGLAYDAYLVRHLAQQKSFKGGQLGFLYQTMKCLFRYPLSKAAVQVNDQQIIDQFYTINVGICRYSGGGMQLVPHAIPDDGLLALTIAGQLSIPEILFNTYRFYTGTLDRHPKIQTFQTERLRVQALEDQPTLVEADGEFLGETPVEFRVLPKALRVIVP
ncbi:MAG: diacylglycerol kinase family protein [Bacteroidota bacterium]